MKDMVVVMKKRVMFVIRVMFVLVIDVIRGEIGESVDYGIVLEVDDLEVNWFEGGKIEGKVNVEINIVR